MVYKITIFLTRGSQGFSESYWVSLSATQPPWQLIQAMLPLRMAMCPSSTMLAGVRVAIVGQRRASILLMPGVNQLGNAGGQIVLPFKGVYLASAPVSTNEITAVSMQIRAIFGNNYKAIRYLTPIPSELADGADGGLLESIHPKWYDQWIAYKTFLLAKGFGMMARSQIAPYNQQTIGSLTVGGSTGTLLGVVVPGAVAPPNFPPGRVQISRCRPPKGTRELSLNGLWMVDSISASQNPVSLTVYLAGSAGILPSSVRLTPASSLQIVQLAFTPWVALNVLRVGTHKRGRPSLALRGRTLRRSTLDP